MEGNPIWVKQHTHSEKILIVLLLLASIVAIGLAITVGILLNEANTKPGICVTSGCIHTSAKLLESIDPSVDPCDDFYQFACGRFIRERSIPDDKSAVSTSSLISDMVEEQLRAMIEEPITKNEPKPYTLIKKLYKACMNKPMIEEIGLKEIEKMIAKFGGWPVLDSGKRWNEKDFHWQRLIYKFAHNGLYTDNLISLYVQFDEKNSSRRLINLDQPFLVLSKETVGGLGVKVINAYHKYMVNVAVAFGANETKAELELNEALAFEISLANITDSIEDRRNSVALYNPMTIKELQKKYPLVAWLEYINNIMSPHVTVTDDEVVVVNCPNYFVKLNKLLQTTPKRVQANYIMWKGIQPTIVALSDALRKIQLQFSTALTGKTEMDPRWKQCTVYSTTYLDLAASALYARKYFRKEAKRNIEELVTYIHAQLKKSLKKVDWMDEETRKHALEKADTIKTHIGYPIELLDDAKLEEYYQGLEVDEKDYLRSGLNISLFNNKLTFGKLRLPMNKTDWTRRSSAAAVNAFYSSNENSIEFPAGILQGVYFSHDRPNYMNYGGIGFIIGHEITHGFDDEGRQYDKDGNLQDWWIPETEKAFKKKAQCIVDFYSNYTLDEIGQNLNGVNSQGENIADIGGLKHAYLAYNEWEKEHGSEASLPGLNYTNRQMFWISSANIWCSKARPEVLKQRLYDDVHTPDKYRVLGVVSNLNEFSEDFNCPVNSKMNAIDKCVLW